MKTPRHLIKTLGGSDAPVIFGLTKYKTPADLQREKLFGEVSQEQTALMALGNHMEPFILKMYELQAKMKTKRTGKITHSKKYPWMHVSVDAWTRPYIIPGMSVPVSYEPFPLEVKMLTFPAYGEWGEEGSDQIPDNYLVQCQHNLAVTESPYLEVPAFIYGRLKVYRIQRDEEFIAKLVEAERVWFDTYITRGEPVPDFTGNFPMLPIDSTPALILEPQEEHFLEKYQNLTEMINTLQKLKNEAHNTILARLGTHSAAVGPSGLMVERKQYMNKGYTVEPFEVQRIYVRKMKSADKLNQRIKGAIENEQRTSETRELTTGD